MTFSLGTQAEEQIIQCTQLLKDILGHDLLGIYLYGSAIVGGLQKYSDIDLLVVSSRGTTIEEKKHLITHLLQISGIYLKSSKRPLEMTMVVHSEINPWRYPPHFDFQYGDWLRGIFEEGIIEPWDSKEMPDLAVLITQVLLASKTIMGVPPQKLLDSVPYKDFVKATTSNLESLRSELKDDTRNVLLTFARMWCTLETDTIFSKPEAATWALAQLPQLYHPVMKRARDICLGDEKEDWQDIKDLLQPCADYMMSKINQKISLLESNGYHNKTIKMADVGG